MAASCLFHFSSSSGVKEVKRIGTVGEGREGEGASSDDIFLWLQRLPADFGATTHFDLPHKEGYSTLCIVLTTRHTTHTLRVSNTQYELVTFTI